MMKLFEKPNSQETRWGLIYYFVQLWVLPLVLSGINALLPHPYSETILNFLYFFVNFSVVLWIFRKFLWQNFQILRAFPWHVLRYAGIGFLMYLGGNYLFDFLFRLLGLTFENANDASIALMVEENFTIMTIGTVVLVPLVEECFYRALFFRNLYGRNAIWAYALSMGLFALVHVIGYVTLVSPATLLLSFLQYLPAGFALAWSYRHSGSIFAPILVHMTVNQTGMLMMR